MDILMVLFPLLLLLLFVLPTLTTGATAGTGASAWQRETFLFLISKDKVWLSKICLWLIIIINVLLAIFHSCTYFKIYYNIESTIEFIYYSFNNFHFVVTALNAIFWIFAPFFVSADIISISYLINQSKICDFLNIILIPNRWICAELPLWNTINNYLRCVEYVLPKSVLLIIP